MELLIICLEYGSRVVNKDSFRVIFRLSSVLLFSLRRFVNYSQCDQIWRNFGTRLSTLAILKVVIKYLAKF